MHWATRLYRQATHSVRPAARRGRRQAPRLRVEGLEGREVPAVTGMAFVDLNQDGVQDVDDVGAAGVTVTATDAAGAVETVTTGADGSYALLTDADDLRIVFSTLPENTYMGRVTEATGPLVRFLNKDSDRAAVDVALTTPQLVTTQFWYDHAIEGVNSAEPAVVAVPYGAESAIPTALATVAEVGSVWGVAYNPRANLLYTSAFLKRHAGFGPASGGLGTTTGGIYKLDPTGVADPVLLVDLNAAGIGGTGADPHPTTAEGAQVPGDWFHDTGSLGLVGKRALGGLAVSPDGRTLYTVNLFTRELVEVPLKADGTWDNTQVIRHTSIPLGNPGGGISSFTAADLRPFAVALRGTAVFVGVTYTAETSGIAGDVRAAVYAFDQTTHTFRNYNQPTGAFSGSGTPTPVLVANLTYPRGLADDPTPDEPGSGDEVGAEWKAWTGAFTTSLGQDGYPIHPEPWLTDLAFDGATMVLGLRDRFGDRTGYLTGSANTADETEYTGIAVGDVLRAAPAPANPNPNVPVGWVLESGGTAGGVKTGGEANTQGPGNGEFYYEDKGEPVPDEVATGGLAQVPGFRTIAVTGNDPLSQFSGGLYTLFNTDTAAATDVNTAGTTDTKTGIYETFDLNTFGSANGLGDVTALAGPGTVQVGDRVFADADSDGVQDANEAGISGVVVRLFQAGTEVDSVATGAAGDYLFDGLVDVSAYEIRIDTTQAALSGRTLTLANQGTDDELDSDATLGGTTATIAFTTGSAGTSDHSRDAGFTGTPTTGTTVTVGNLVYRDVNNNGTLDGTETGVAGVVVELMDGAATSVLSTTTTSSGGTYSFAGLTPGTYQVRLPAVNFTGTGALVGFVSSTASAADPNDNVDGDDNGIVTGGSLGSGGVVQSGPIALALGAEPTTDGDGSDGNLTLDFGVVPPATTGLTLGNAVFRDVNNNGTFDPTETGIAGVTVELLDAAGTTVVGTTTTNVSGQYTFSGLTAATYQARLAVANFTGTGPLVGFTPSTTAVANADSNVNNDSNGTASGTLGSGGFVIAGPIALALGAEPTTDGDGADGNLTLDFGMVPPAATGTLTLGNAVFRDVNNNGIFDGTDAGIVGVTVDLLDQAGTTVLATATTAAGGVYTFAGLAGGTYRVRLAATNFNTGGPLVGFTPSGTVASNADNNVNNDSNGSSTGALGSGGFIVSGPITLAAGTEPTTDGDGADGNLTLDFGVVPPAATGTLTLGNTVYNDANNNGTFDTSETGVTGVSVQLLDATGAVLATATTAAGGTYTFPALLAGDYRVRLAATNFNTGGPLANFTSSTATATDPDDNVNSNDDGAPSGALGSGGFIQSGLITLAAGTEPTTDGDGADGNLTLDFGVVAVAANTLTVGDKVFVDTNNNGQLDGAEAGIDGVTVQLLNTGGTVLQTTTTAGGGTYSFSGLAAGDYKVRLPALNFNPGGILAGYTSSTGTGNAFEGTNTPDPDGNANGDDNGSTTGTLGAAGFVESKLITLALGTEPTNDGDTNNNTNLSLDFGVVAPAVGNLTLGGTVWNDANNNGQQIGSEVGVSGVTVKLVNASGVEVQTATTGANGTYSFTGLAAGDYKVRLSASNFTGTNSLFGFTSSTGTNGSATGGSEGPTTPDPDTNADGDDNGQVSGTLGGTGVIESGTITLSAGTEPTDDGDGADANQTLDLGVFRKLVIGNTVFRDTNNNGTQDATETGVPSVTVRLLNPDAANAVVATTTTNGQGQYLFTPLLAGNYVVELAATNFNGGGPLFNFKSSTGTGTAFEPAPGTATDKQDHGTTVGTLGSGGRVVSGTIALSATGPTGETPNTDTTTPDAQANLTVDFGVFQQTPATASITGRVFLDYNNSGTPNGPDSGITGVTVTLTGGALANPITVQTDAAGNYTFTNLPAGTYTVTETQPTTPANQNGKTAAGSAGGSTTTTNAVTGIVLAIGQAATGYNFAEIPIVSTGGFVFEDLNGNGIKNEGEPGIGGVQVTLTGTPAGGTAISPRTVTTNATTGAYTFDGLVPGTYSIAEAQPSGFTDGREQNGSPAATVGGDRFTNINLTTVATSGGFNFGEVKGTSISGFVYTDANNDGVKAATGEPGIAGAKIRLLGTNDQGVAVDRTLTTGTDGGYTFGNLRPGAYRLFETAQPAGYRDGKETAGTAGGVVTTNERITGIQLASGVAATGYLFGEQAAADVVVTQSPVATSINPGGTVTITYTVRNRGTAPATATTVVMNYGGLTFVSASVPAEFATATRTWTVGDLAAGASKTIRLTLRAPVASTYTPTSQASTTATELSTTNNRGGSTISVGVTPPPPTTGGAMSRLWLLSSHTNAFLRR